MFFTCASMHQSYTLPVHLCISVLTLTLTHTRAHVFHYRQANDNLIRLRLTQGKRKRTNQEHLSLSSNTYGKPYFFPCVFNHLQLSLSYLHFSYCVIRNHVVNSIHRNAERNQTMFTAMLLVAIMAGFVGLVVMQD